MNRGTLGYPGSELLTLPPPSGGFFIAMWSGAVNNVPLGWQLCDGTGGTPDLRNRFIVGAGDTYSPGDTGGSNADYTPTGTNSAPTFTGDALPSHTHTTPTEGIFNGTGGTLGGTGDPVDVGKNADNTSIESVTLTPAGTVSAPVFTGDTVSVLPAYYALCFIAYLGLGAQ